MYHTHRQSAHMPLQFLFVPFNDCKFLAPVPAHYPPHPSPCIARAAAHLATSKSVCQYSCTPTETRLSANHCEWPLPVTPPAHRTAGHRTALMRRSLVPQSKDLGLTTLRDQDRARDRDRRNDCHRDQVLGRGLEARHHYSEDHDRTHEHRQGHTNGACGRASRGRAMKDCLVALLSLWRLQTL